MPNKKAYKRIPMEEKQIKALRNDFIKHAYNAGFSKSLIAKVLNVHRSTVLRSVGRIRKIKINK